MSTHPARADDIADLTERRLVAAVLSGSDEASFRTLYRLHAAALYRVALRMLGGSEADAEDVLQESWRRALAGLGAFRFDAPLRAWLRAITVRCALEALRARERARGTDGTDGLEVPLPAAPELRLTLEGALEGLPAGFRTVLTLHDIEGYTHQEIGDLLGIQPGTSKSQLSRARAWMRRALGEDER